MANDTIKKTKRSFQPSINTEASTLSAIQNNIILLNNKLNDATKNLTQFDFLNIAQVITDKNDLDSIVNNLVPGSAAIVNTNETIDEYGRGDIIYKTQNNELLHVSAQQSGYFYPLKLVNSSGNNYTLTYKFTSSAPAEDLVSKPVGSEFTTVAKQMSITDITSTGNSTIYGIVRTSNFNTSFNKIAATTGGTDYIIPIIKCYNSNNEEVYLPDQILITDSDNTKWKLQNIPSLIVSTVIIK